MTPKKEAEKLAEQLRKIESSIKLPDSAAEAMRRIVELSSLQPYSSSIAAELARAHDSAAVRIAAQMQDISILSQEWRKQFNAIQKMIEESQSGLALASEFARAQAVISDHVLKVQSAAFPQFEIPVFPKLQFAKVDFEAFTKNARKGAVHMADCGWMIASWMIPGHVSGFATALEEEIEDYFLEQYLGNDSFEGCLKRTSDDLLTSAKLKKWHALLKEVFQCIEEGKSIICVPALVSVIEGFISEALIKALKISHRHVRPNKALQGAKWHENDTIDGLVWMSAVVFINNLFADAPFNMPKPTFINRHWILHGRSETEWKQVDALKLVNALAALHWLFD